MAGIFGQLESAQLENLAGDPANAPRGRVYYNTVLQVVRYYNGSTWLTLESSGTNPTGYTKYVGTGIGHYANLALALAAAVAGDRILVTIDTTHSVSLVIPASVTVECMPAKRVIFTADAGLALQQNAQFHRANVLWQGGSFNRTDGVNISGTDSCFEGNLVWASSGTLANVFTVSGNRARVWAAVSRATGVITNPTNITTAYALVDVVAET